MFEKIKVYIKLWLKSLFVLPATTMHELMHFLIAILTLSKITSFNLIPKIKWDDNNPAEIIYGSVGYVPKLKMLHIPISLAPLLLIPLSWFMLYYFHIINILVDFSHLYVNYSTILSIKGIIALFAVIEMLWGSIPSTQDLKNVKDGILSLSFLFFMIVAVGIYYDGDTIISQIDHIVSKLPDNYMNTAREILQQAKELISQKIIHI